MKITPKFYSRKMPTMIDGEIRMIIPQGETSLRMFIRDDDSDKDNPSRVCVEMSRSEVHRLIDELQHYLPSIMLR